MDGQQNAVTLHLDRGEGTVGRVVVAWSLEGQQSAGDISPVQGTVRSAIFEKF